MRTYRGVLIILFSVIISVNLEKESAESVNSYSDFLNYGEKKSTIVNKGLYENDIFKTKVDILGEIFKSNVEKLKKTSELDIIFLIDGSSSVGEDNFRSEIKFVKKLLSDVTIDLNNTRVGIITFSSSDNVFKSVDGISVPRNQNNKCLLLNKQLTAVNYVGGETFTLGAFQVAKTIFENSRNTSRKVLFLITDGFSNGGDPVPVAEELKNQGTTIFTIGIQNGNYKELYKLSSEPGETHSYLLNSFEEFESLARRALHVDLKVGDYIPLGINSPCDHLCKEGDCCHKNAVCTCGTSSGHYSCICPAGYYGTGLKDEGCFLCPVGSYSDGPNLCTPCPDAFHITKPPAYGRDSCKCKTGYKSKEDDTSQCEAVTCQKLKEPKHGYFVKKTCDIVVNSACGTRCDVGYNLVGTSIRLCQNNGSWSGITPSCQVRTCEKLTPPEFGSMICSHSDLGITFNEDQTSFPVDTVCSFECQKGKIFIGSKHRTCLPVAKWNGLRAMCRQIKCSKIPPIANARIEPKSCSHGKQAFGKKCSIVCNEGFEAIGPVERSCTGDFGAWDTKENTYCKDITPPIVNCPDNITGLAKTGLNYGHVLWEAPPIIDNSDDELIVWTKPPVVNLSSYQFLIGETNISYYAEDSAGNQGICTTTVTILDDERPTIENCINPTPSLSDDGVGANVTWDEPYIYDNAHHAKVTRSHNFGYFKKGSTTVTYTATDDAGNKNICQMNITVKEAKCDDFQAPANGRSECSRKKNVTSCIASCEDGFSLQSSLESGNETNSNMSVITFFCNATENLWYNEEGLPLPECSIIRTPNETIQNGTINLDYGCEDDGSQIKEVENDMVSVLTNEVCIGDCSITTNSSCLEESEHEINEEESNIIRRDVTSGRSSQRRGNRKRKKKLQIKVQVKAPFKEAKVLSELNIHNSTLYFDSPQYSCLEGYIPKKNRCVQCPRGTFQLNNKCLSCDFGFYNSNFGKTSCTSCPTHFSTKRMRSKSITDCEKQCPPGTKGRRKLPKNSKKTNKKALERATLQPFCKSCPIGYYQHNYGQLQCIPCPQGYTTHGYGSTDVGQCVETAEEICLKSTNICNNGSCVARDRIHYECDCLGGYIGSHCERRLDVCEKNPCQNGGTCIVTYDTNNQPQYKCLCFENFSGSYCEREMSTCKIRCENSGHCLEYDDNLFMCLCPEGYEGEICQSTPQVCERDLCSNNGTCVEKFGDYECECSKGFVGKRCHLLPCDYKPCAEDAICQNIEEKHASKSSYRCVCPEGKTGKSCDINVDYCTPNPCQNKGICRSTPTTFKCDCPKPFYGNECGSKEDPKYVLVFDRFGTTDYVKLPPFDEQLREITVCIWLKVIDTFNYGTLVSYATRDNDNAFTLTDYTGLIMYVNGEHIATDAFLNDGIWHHVCATWRSEDGIYQVFIDGRLKQFGSGLSKDKVIDAKGSMIIGQEQDIMGGMFSQSESFVGRMTLIDMWSRVLSKDEIQKHFQDCDNPIYGNLYSWTDFKYHIRGNLKIEPSEFCQECPKPKRVINGLVEVRNKSAFYSCEAGYFVGNDYQNGRKCLKSAKWEGQREPYCRRVYCGPPGFLKNGNIRGINYYFEDQVTCGCIDGYNLTGTAVLTCQKNGKWEPAKPTCLGPQCRAFRIPNFGKVTVFAEAAYEKYEENKTRYDVATQIEVVCDPGTNLVGEPVITCLEDGEWDNNPPVCEIIITTTEKPPRCSLDHLPPAVPNGYILKESMENYRNETAEEVLYSCKDGFRQNGENITICEGGVWTEVNMTCKKITCEIEKEIENGIIIGNTYRFGDILSAECNIGYELNETNTLVCGKDGSWQGVLPTCTKVTCSVEERIEHGHIIGDIYMFGDKIDVECSPGYNLNDNNTLICGEDGNWQGISPKCSIISCELLGDISNGRTIGTNISYGNKINFTCDDGYILQGISSLTCGSDGTWSSKAPECRRVHCDSPGDIENGLKFGRSYKYGDYVTFECNEGFVLNGSNSIKCGRDGLWRPSKPSCKKVYCGEIYNITNAIVHGNSFYYKDAITVECNVGFVLEGNIRITCGIDGKWDSIPKCTRISCEQPRPLEHGSSNGNSYYYNDRIIWECDERFVLEGSPYSLCNEDGSWVPPKPTCTEKVTTSTTVATVRSSVNCKNPKIPLIMVKQGDDQNSIYGIGSSIYFDCIEGYKMVGNNFIRCSKYGRWSRLQGRCRRVSCRQPEVSKKTKIIGESYLYEDVVTIICANGSKYNLTCNKEGIWEGAKDNSC